MSADEVAPRSALSYALTGERPYDKAADILARLEAIGWTVAPKPKPAEPTGLGAVVEDADGSLLVRVPNNPDKPWSCGGVTRWSWSDIDAVRVLSEGVTA